MTPEKLLKLSSLLVEYTLELEEEPPHDYQSLREHILLLELQEEVKALWTLRADPNSFEENLKSRCLLRATTADSLSIQDMPVSITNELYWKIAKLLFEPHTMEEMLRILLPNITKQLCVTLPDSFIECRNAKEGARYLTPLVALNNLNALKATPEFSALANFVFVDNVLLNLEDIASFSLFLHSKLYQYLYDHHINIANKLYMHNSALMILAADCKMFVKVITPKEALEQLIRCLLLGGNRVSGQTYATRVADDALKQFLSYYQCLPTPTKLHLRNLKGNDKDFGYILDNDIEHGMCVETMASGLSAILAANQQDLVLLTPPTISLEQLKQLEKKYRGNDKNQLLIKKDDTLITKFPPRLARAAISTIQPDSVEKWIDLIIQLPTHLYDLLWEHVILNDAKSTLNSIADILRHNVLDDEQTEALAKAIARHYKRFNLVKPLSYWAFKTENATCIATIFTYYTLPELLQIFQDIYKDEKNYLFRVTSTQNLLPAILAKMPLAQRLALLSITNHHNKILLATLIKNGLQRSDLIFLLGEGDCVTAINVGNKILKPIGTTLLHLLALRPVMAINFISLLPIHNRLTYIKATDKYGRTILNEMAPLELFLSGVINLIPEEQRLEAITGADIKGNTLLHNAANYPESLRLLLSLYPETEKLQAINIINKKNRRVLHKAKQFESLKMLLQLYPEHQKLAAVKSIHSKHSMLYRVADRAHSNSLILSLYPSSERKSVLLQSTKQGSTTLFRAHQDPEALRCLFSLLPKEDILPTIMHRDTVGNTLLHHCAVCPEAVTTVLKFVDETQWLKLMTTENNAGDSVIIRLLKCLSTDNIPAFLGFFPREQLVELLNSNKDTPLLFQLIDNPQKIERVITFLSFTQRLELLNAQTNAKRSVLSTFLSFIDIFEILLKSLPDSQRITALKGTDRENNYLLNKIIINPELISKVLALLTTNEIIELFKTPIAFGPIALGNVWNYLISSSLASKALHTWLSFIPNHHLFELFTDENGPLLAYAIEKNSFTSFNILLDTLTPQQKMEVILFKKDRQQNLLELTHKNSRFLEAMIKCLPVTLRLEIFKQTNGNIRGHNYLDILARNPECTSIVLESLTEAERLELLSMGEGETTLHRISHNTAFIRTALNSLRESKRLELCKSVDTDGRTILHVASTYEGKAMILHFLPETERFELVKIFDEYGETVLHRIIDEYPRAVLTIISLLPEHQRAEALKLGIGDDPVLRRIKSADHLKQALLLIPESQRAEIFTLAIKKSKTMISSLINHFDILLNILENLPEQQRFGALKQINLNKECLFTRTLSNTHQFIKLLHFLPESSRLKVFSLVKHGMPLLANVCDSPEELKLMLATIPESERLQIILAPANSQHTLLELVVKYQPRSLISILLLLPECQRFTLLKRQVLHQTVTQALVTNYLCHLNLSEFKESFLPIYLKVYALLCDKSALSHSSSFFANSNDASKLLNKINRCTTFEGVEDFIIQYIENNPKTTLTNDLLKIATELNAINILKSRPSTLDNVLTRILS